MASGLKRPKQPMPAFVHRALEEEGLMPAYQQRPPYQQNDYLGWINRAKRDDTKHKRLNQMLKELRQGNKYMNMDWRPKGSIQALLLVMMLALPADPVHADEECDFDQANRYKENLTMVKRFPGSRYDKQEYTVRIPVKGGMVSVNKGGCVHYGLSIEFATRTPNAYKREADLFRKLVELLRLYGDDMMQADDLQKLLANGKWRKLYETYYNVESTEFEVFELYRKVDGGETIIGLSFYN